MIVEIDVDGRSRKIAIERRGRDWMVTVDGRSVIASAAAVDGRWSFLIGEEPRQSDGDAAPARRSYEVTFESAEGRQLVRVDGQPVRLGLVDARARVGPRRADGRAGHDGPGAVVAPMPGRIVKVLVERGQTVAARQGVVVVEAMKMENELRAPRAGTVSEVHVTEGMSVEAHAVLVVLE